MEALFFAEITVHNLVNPWEPFSPNISVKRLLNGFPGRLPNK
jgi:hypothetical protein